MNPEVDRILQTLEQATPEQYAQGEHWYATAHTFATGLADTHGMTLTSAVGVVAALSPGCNWERNLTLAEQFAQTGDAPHPYGHAIRTARLAATGTPFDTLYVKGYKVRSFYRNILNPADPYHVTIDRHAYAITQGRPCTDAERRTLDTLPGYIRVAAHYHEAAAQTGLIPATLQAITWCVWREGH